MNSRVFIHVQIRQIDIIIAFSILKSIRGTYLAFCVESYIENTMIDFSLTLIIYQYHNQHI